MAPTKIVAKNAFTEAEIIIDLSSFGSSIEEVRIENQFMIIQMRTVSGYEVLILIILLPYWISTL
jgi:hypothetical protein